MGTELPATVARRGTARKSASEMHAHAHARAHSLFVPPCCAGAADGMGRLTRWSGSGERCIEAAKRSPSALSLVLTGASRARRVSFLASLYTDRCDTHVECRPECRLCTSLACGTGHYVDITKLVCVVVQIQSAIQPSCLGPTLVRGPPNLPHIARKPSVRQVVLVETCAIPHIPEMADKCHQLCLADRYRDGTRSLHSDLFLDIPDVEHL